MLDSFNRFFDDRHPRRPSGFMPLPDEPALFDLLSRVIDTPAEDRYPLQLQLYEMLLAYRLLLPVPPDTDLDQGLPILALENPRGEHGLPLFTSEATMRLWDAEHEDYVAIPFATLCGYALQARIDYILINVGSLDGCEIPFHDFSYLAEGLLPPPTTDASSDGPKPGEVLIQKDTPLRLALCPGLSEPLMDRLQQVFQHHQTLIKRVYLFEVAFNDGPLQPALGVRMPEGAETQWEMELWPNMQAILHEMLERREVLNVFLLNEAGSMEHHLQDLTAPIYETPPR